LKNSVLKRGAISFAFLAAFRSLDTGGKNRMKTRPDAAQNGTIDL
jgi:hypothetical protein